MDKHGHYGEVLGPYLLEALDPAEEREVERHLAAWWAAAFFGQHTISPGASSPRNDRGRQDAVGP